MPDPKLAVRPKTIVLVSAQTLEGKDVVQEILITHDPGTPDALIIGKAYAMTLQAGGLMNDGEDGCSALFYPWPGLKVPIRYGVKKIQLVQTDLIS